MGEYKKCNQFRSQGSNPVDVVSVQFIGNDKAERCAAAKANFQSIYNAKTYDDLVTNVSKLKREIEQDCQLRDMVVLIDTNRSQQSDKACSVFFVTHGGRKSMISAPMEGGQSASPVGEASKAIPGSDFGKETGKPEAPAKSPKMIKSETIGDADEGEGWPRSLFGSFLLAAFLFGCSELIYQIWLRRPPYKKKPVNGTVYLFQFRRTHSMPNLSPKCLALESWLRLAKINFEIVDDNPWLHDYLSCTVPLIEFNGMQYSGMQTIFVKLTEIFSTPDLQPNDADAITETTEQNIEQLMWCYFYFRFVLNEKQLLSVDCIGTNKPTLPIMPWTTDALFRMVINYDASYQAEEREEIAKKLVAHMKELVLMHGFKSELSYRETGFACLDAVSAQLAQKRYLFGDENPSATDTFLFGVSAQIFFGPYKSPFKNYMIAKCHNLINHCREMKTLAWPDWENDFGATD